MNAKKFVAATSREALRLVRDDLGPDAVILSNRKVGNGVEIVALAGSELSALTELRAQTAAAVPAPAPKKVLTGTHQLAAAYAARPAAAPAQMAAPVTSVKPVATARPAAVPGAPDQQMALMSEIKSMRNMLQEQLACIGWSDMQQRSPERARLLRDLLNAGFSPTLARHLLEKLPNDAGPSWIKKVIEYNLRIVRQDESLVTRGGVYALVGPTGVGKTTTTAKLAARAVVRYGAKKVALISSDSYRIGAHEQLSIYAKMLGIEVHSVHNADELKRTLSALRDKHLVLIDTIGMGQRDNRVAAQTQMYDSCGVKRLLLLNATSGGETLEEVVRKYRTVGVVGCIPTKLDEAASVGTVLDVAVRHQLPLHYIANGQRVPEDLHEVNVEYLLHRAFKPSTQPAPFALNELEFPVLMAGQGGAPLAGRRLAA
jgi:flagellar biosynthesis protein FlhF